jgi:purine-binding chemotaxis protein CheW
MEIRAADGGQSVIGALADEVHEVIEIKDENLEPAPSFGTKIDTGLIHSIGKREGAFIIVLDIDKAFNEHEAALLAETATAKA